MDRMEILKLAFSKANTGKEALELAREIESFLKGGDPVPRWLTESADATAAPQPKSEARPANYRTYWTPKELSRLSRLMQEGKTISQICEIMGRSYNAINSAIHRITRGEYVVPALPEQGTTIFSAGTFPGRTT